MCPVSNISQGQAQEEDLSLDGPETQEHGPGQNRSREVFFRNNRLKMNPIARSSRVRPARTPTPDPGPVENPSPSLMGKHYVSHKEGGCGEAQAQVGCLTADGPALAGIMDNQDMLLMFVPTHVKRSCSARSSFALSLAPPMLIVLENHETIPWVPSPATGNNSTCPKQVRTHTGDSEQ